MMMKIKIKIRKMMMMIKIKFNNKNKIIKQKINLNILTMIRQNLKKYINHQSNLKSIMLD